MRALSPHRGRHASRRLRAFLLLAVYLLIALTPLMSLAMQSGKGGRMLTGECAGDCNICGCSMESRMNQTCCCARKKSHEQHPELSQADADEPECCRKIREESAASDSKESHPGHDDTNRNVTVLKCGCPCDNGKQMFLSGSGFFELLPYNHTHDDQPYAEASHYPSLVRHMNSRHAEPPDPPPRLPRLS